MKEGIMKIVLPLLLVLNQWLPNFAHADVPRYDGPEMPFPLSTQLPFSWALMPGIWLGQDEETAAFYSFEVVNCDGSRPLLRVFQFDPESETMLAEGWGRIDRRYVTDTVSAALRGPFANYLILVRNFHNTIRKDLPPTATVLTIRRLAAPLKDYRHLIMHKLSDTPVRHFRNMICSDKEFISTECK